MLMQNCELNFSERTKSIIKNFSTINPSLLFNSGSELKTISSGRDILAVATIEENIPKEFGIHDLAKFLSILSTFKNPVLQLGDNSFVITSKDYNHKKYEYRYTDPSNIFSPGVNKLDFSKEVATFPLSSTDLTELMKIVSISKLPEVCFSTVTVPGKLIVQAIDIKNSEKATSGSDKYINEISDWDQGELGWRYDFTCQKIQVLMPGNYDVVVGQTSDSGLVSKFSSENVTYWVAPETSSKH